MIYTDLDLALNKENSYVYSDKGNNINIVLRKLQNLNLFLFVKNEKNIKITLEKGAKIFLNSLILSDKQAKLNIEIIHKNSNSKSEIYTASLGKNNSKTSVITKIIAGKNLENIETHTNHEHLNLGKNSSVTSLPQMFIDTKNIIAGHSSKIENLDKNFNFFLESKGLNNSQIKNLFIQSYYNKVFHQMGILDREYCNNLKNNLLKLI